MAKRNDIIVMIVLAFLLLLIVAAVIVISHKKKAAAPQDYNGFKFYNTGTHWMTEVLSKKNDLITVYFRFLPKDVKDIPVNGTLNGFSTKGYLLFDPYDKNLSLVGLGASELGLSLGKVFNADFSKAYCTRPFETEGQCIGVMTCESTNESVIIIRSAPTDEIIYKDNHCIILQGDEWGILKSVDKFLYMMYGIIR